MRVQIQHIIVFYALAISTLMMLPVQAQESSVVTAILEEASGDITILDELLSEHEALLNRYPNSEFAPTLMFQLAELHYERSQLVFQKEMALYEEQLASFQKGELMQEPHMPTLSMDKTIFYCSSLIERYPNVKYRDKVMYKLATAYMDEGDQDKAKANYELLTQEHPNSPIALEAHFRIGEYLFDHRQFDQAIDHYRLLLSQWDSPYYGMALYKLGWTYYNLAEYSKAISTFLALIEDINVADGLDIQESMTKVDLRTESIHYIASSFTEHGGTALAKDFFAPMKAKEYTPAILKKMAELYEIRNTYSEAIATYRMLLEYYPYHQDAPHHYAKIVQDYEAVHDIAAANRTREEIVDYFGPGSQWSQQHQQGELHAVGLQTARDNLIALGTFYQAQAQQPDSAHLYAAAILKYQEYISKFPHEKNSSEISYFLAECFFNANKFVDAAEAYRAVVINYADSPYREKAAYNRIFSYVKMKGSHEAAQELTVAIPSFIATADTVVVHVSDPADGHILASCNDFCLQFPNSSWLDQVYMKYGQVLNDNRAYPEAVQVYKKVIELEPASPYKIAAAMSAGQSYFDDGDYQEALDWFSAIPKAFPDSTDQIDRALRMAASSQFKIAEQLSAAGETSQAAAVLLGIAHSSSNATFQQRALFEAAAQLQKTDSLAVAARTYEQLAAVHPQAELSDKALYQAGAIRESLGDWPRAAANYLKVFELYAGSKAREQSLKNAISCYENGGDWLAAKKCCQRYIEAFPDRALEVIEFTCKAGDMAYKASQVAEARSFFAETVRTFHRFLIAGESLDSYFVAQAQFMIGEILYEEYTKLNLLPPFDKNLQVKIAAFTEVVRAYTESIKYQIADWSTASSHRIGMCFEEFVRAFMQAPIPDNLDAEQIQLYKDKLAEKALPYKEKALATYMKNIEQAEANGIENRWVTDSRARMQALMQELQFGGQTDMSSTEGS